MATAPESRGEGIESVTRIAGTLFQFFRRERGLRAGDFYKPEAKPELSIDEGAISRVEHGEFRIRWYRDHFGDIASYLKLPGEDIVLVLDAAWVDEVLADMVALSRRPAGKKRRCLALLQYLWSQPNTRPWLKVLFLANPTHDSAGPCIGRHPAILRRDNKVKRGGAAGKTPEDSLKGTLFVDKVHGAEMLSDAIRVARDEAIAMLQESNETDVAKIGEMLLLFADLASRDDESRRALSRSLAALRPASLSPVDRRYRARALYLLGDGSALCAEVSSASDGSTACRTIVDHYLHEARDDGKGVVALQSLCSHIDFAREKKSAPLLALYLITTYDLIKSSIRQTWPQALANIATTRDLRAMTSATLRDFDKIRRNAHNADAPNWTDHGCRRSPTCQEHAERYARLIETLVEDAGKSIGFKSHGGRRGPSS